MSMNEFDCRVFKSESAKRVAERLNRVDAAVEEARRMRDSARPLPSFENATRERIERLMQLKPGDIAPFSLGDKLLHFAMAVVDGLSLRQAADLQYCGEQLPTWLRAYERGEEPYASVLGELFSEVARRKLQALRMIAAQNPQRAMTLQAMRSDLHYESRSILSGAEPPLDDQGSLFGPIFAEDGSQDGSSDE